MGGSMPNLHDSGPDGLNLLTATEMAAQIAAGKISSEAVVTDCLTRIEARNGELDAWAFIDPDLALMQARERDGGSVKGLLHGVPVGVKDILDTADMPTEYGSALYPGHRPDKDCLTVQRLREAGAVILGKTKTTEFASPFPTTTKNPRDVSRTPGVSSSGSAAAVADYMVPLSNGTQTGGSVIRPAALCGTYGYKASHRFLDPSGIPMWKVDIDTLGHFGRSIPDLDLMRAALTAGAKTDLSVDANFVPKIGICRTPEWSDATPENIAMIDWISDMFRGSVGTVDDLDFPVNFNNVMKGHGVITGTNGAAVMPDLVMENLDKVNPWTRMRTEEAAKCTTADIEEAHRVTSAARKTLAALFSDYDFLLTPGGEGEASTNTTGVIVGGFNALWTIMYVPCVTIPAFEGPNGLPVGLQIIGPFNQDERTLSLAGWLDDKIKAAGGPIKTG